MLHSETVNFIHHVCRRKEETIVNCEPVFVVVIVVVWVHSQLMSARTFFAGGGVLRFSKNGRTLITFQNPLSNCERTFVSGEGGGHETESRDDDFFQ